MTKQEETQAKLSEKIYKELEKGFLNFLVYGREGYYIAPDGEIRAISDDELERVIHEGEIPEGHVGYIFPRSSVYKHQVSLANCVGVIDSSYRGEIFLKFRIVQPHISRYTVGDKIGQLIIQPYPEIEFEEVDELDESDRGDGGFGSSGR